MERNDLPSSRGEYDGQAARLEVDYDRDIISLGPLEENAHFENPNDAGGRQRVLEPGVPFALEPAFVALGTARRRCGVAALPLPRPPPADALPEGDHLQLERHRQRRPLDRCQGRHRHRGRPPGRADRAQARNRDVHPRRRLAGPLRRLAAGLTRVPRAALGRAAGLEVRAALPGLRVQCGPRGDRADAPRPLVDAASLPPLLRDLQAAPRVDLPADRRRAPRLQHRRAPGQLERGRARHVGPGRASPHRGAADRCDRELGRPLLQVGLHGLARLRRPGRHLHVPRGPDRRCSTAFRRSTRT